MSGGKIVDLDGTGDMTAPLFEARRSDFEVKVPLVLNDEGPTPFLTIPAGHEAPTHTSKGEYRRLDKPREFAVAKIEITYEAAAGEPWRFQRAVCESAGQYPNWESYIPREDEYDAGMWSVYLDEAPAWLQRLVESQRPKIGDVIRTKEELLELPPHTAVRAADGLRGARGADLMFRWVDGSRGNSNLAYPLVVIDDLDAEKWHPRGDS